MVTVVQLVRASDCGSECRGFESHQSPEEETIYILDSLFFFLHLYHFNWNLKNIKTPNFTFLDVKLGAIKCI